MENRRHNEAIIGRASEVREQWNLEKRQSSSWMMMKILEN